jgi:hypothetical protein
MMMKGNIDMLTLSDINAVTNSNDGDIYSDLYKDVYGCRPRYERFESVEEFDSNFKFLVGQLNRQQDEKSVRQARNFAEFVARVDVTMHLVENIDRVRAIEIIAEAEDELEAFKWYGYERLEWHFNLKYGSIKQWLEAY